MLSGGQSLSWSGCGRLVWVQEVGLLRQAIAREERGRRESEAHWLQHTCCYGFYIVANS